MLFIEGLLWKLVCISSGIFLALPEQMAGIFHAISEHILLAHDVELLFSSRESVTYKCMFINK